MIGEVIESFKRHPDTIDAEGLYDEIADVALGRDTLLSQANTVRRLRNILPSPNLIVREKLHAWLQHHKTVKERAPEIALDRLRCFEPTFLLPSDRQKELA